MRIRWIKKERKESRGEGREKKRKKLIHGEKHGSNLDPHDLVVFLNSLPVPTKLISFLDSRDSSEG